MWTQEKETQLYNYFDTASNGKFKYCLSAEISGHLIDDPRNVEYENEKMLVVKKLISATLDTEEAKKCIAELEKFIP